MSDIREEETKEVRRWQPWMVYVWTKRQLQNWYDVHGASALYDGKLWSPKTKNLGVGRYEVRWAEANGSDTANRPSGFVDVVFDGPPGNESGRFVEVEDMSGKSVSCGEWIDRKNGMWVLRIGVAKVPGGA